MSGLAGKIPRAHLVGGDVGEPLQCFSVAQGFEVGKEKKLVADQAADTLLHTVSPVLCVLGFLLFGPRRLIDPRVAVMACIFPLCWAVFAMIRGALIHFYPYPFIDVDTHGYAKVLLNSVLIAAVFIGLSFAALAYDRFVSRD